MVVLERFLNVYHHYQALSIVRMKDFNIFIAIERHRFIMFSKTSITWMGQANFVCEWVWFTWTMNEINANIV